MADLGGADGLRLTLSKAEAAAALGVSVDFFEDHVMHDLRIVRTCGQVVRSLRDRRLARRVRQFISGRLQPPLPTRKIAFVEAIDALLLSRESGSDGRLRTV
jgi:hypothetical protein